MNRRRWLTGAVATAATALLAAWPEAVAAFVKVMPLEYQRALQAPAQAA